MTPRATKIAGWTSRMILAVMFTTYPASAFAQATGMVRIGSVLVPTAYIFIGGIAIVAIIIAAVIFLRQLPKRSKYRLDWQFNCPRCNTRNSSETPIRCRNCGKGAIRADYYSAHGSTRASFGCTECEGYNGSPKCSSCGADAANRMMIRGKLSWFRPDFHS